VTRLLARTALVTGGARGIGAETALRLATEGADVAVVDLDESAAVQTAKQIAEATGRRVLGIAADVTDTTQITAAVDCAADELGSLGILVNNAGARGQINYSAAKAGLQGATRTLAIELGPFGITANAVAPGFIVTEMTAQLAERMGTTLEEFTAERAAITPVRRAGQPGDIAAVIAFLAGDDASFITGQTIYVDGGRRL
jgi:Dehydrogenases with different specificities (related to short-chain alcohol dehydrogenases)